METTTAKQETVSSQVEQAMISLTTAMRNATFYGIQHRVAKECVGRCHESMSALLEQLGEITVGVQPDQLVYQNMPLNDSVGCLVPLAEELTTRDVGKIAFLPGLEQAEIETLVEALITEERSLELQGGLRHALSSAGVTHILTEATRPDEQDDDQRRKQALQIHREAVETVQRAMSAVEQGDDIDAHSVRTVVEDMVEMLLDDGNALVSLAAIKSYDEYLYEHSVNVAIVSMVFGHTLGLNRQQMADLGMAGMLHDIGKVFVPLEIVRKPGPLTEEEWLVMHSHPLTGARLLGTSKNVPEICAVTAFEHHIRHDRSGYPKLSQNRALHFYSNIICIVDTYDSLTTARPYRPPLRPEQAMGWMLYCGANQFEPRLLARFSTLLRMYPVGAVVQLDTAEWGVITGGSQRDPARPTVRLLVDQSGQTVRANRQVDLGARDQTGGYARSIVGVLQPMTRIAQIAAILTK